MVATNPLADILDTPSLYADTFLRILNKTKKTVPLKHNRAQTHYLAHRTKRDIILKARQMGFSTMLQGELFRKATTSTCTALTLTHKDTTTQSLRRMSDFFYDNIPKPFPKPLRTYANAAVTSYAETGSECMIATAGGRGAGRGVTGSDLHLSEVAYWPDAEETMTGLLESVPEDGSIVIESTPNGQSGWFYDTCMEALRGEGEWTLHFYPWWWADEYRAPLEDGETLEYTDEEKRLVTQHGLDAEQIKWRRKKQKRLKTKFQQEYPEDIQSCFISANGSSVFPTARSVATGIHYADRAAYLKDYPKARFGMGVDWGRDNDWSVFTVIDVTRAVVVAMERMRWIPYTQQRVRLKEMALAWNCERIIAEANSIGANNIEILQGWNLNVQPFMTLEHSKKMIIDGLAAAIEENGITLLQPPAWNAGDEQVSDEEIMIQELIGYQIKKQPSGNYSYEGKPHDDCVISVALALYCVNQSIPDQW